MIIKYIINNNYNNINNNNNNKYKFENLVIIFFNKNLFGIITPT